MDNIYKLFLVILLIFAGSLLVLAGTNLIELSLELLLYLGLGLLALAGVYFFIYPNKKKGGEG